jgi:hypothetical protein
VAGKRVDGLGDVSTWLPPYGYRVYTSLAIVYPE